MKSPLFFQILLLGCLLAITFPANVFHVSAVPSYSPGVKSGDTVTYGNVTGFWQSNTTQSVNLNGAGSSFVSPFISTVSSNFTKANPNIHVSYQAIGSGAGVNALIAKTVDFAASDAPLSASQTSALPAPALHIPETIGAVVVAYNVPGLPTGLKLNATTIAKIFQGQITNWNDSAIRQLNPALVLPNQSITVVHRSDASGTTFVFTGYLNTAASGVWTLGQGTAVAWPVGLGAVGNQGVAGVIQGTQNSLGYVELNYAITNNMKIAYLRNADGDNFVQPTLTNVAYGVTNSSSALPMGNQSWASVSLLNAHGANTYPIVSFSYLLVYRELNIVPGMTLDKARALANFLWYTTHNGQQIATSLNYVSLPASVVAIDEATIISMTYNGQSLQNLPPPATQSQPPAFIAAFLHVQSIHVGVQSVSGSNVNATQTFTFNNGTGPRNFFLSGNVANGSGNLTFWILASGLTAGDRIYNGVSPAINRTDIEFFGGSLRQVIRLSFVANGGNIQLNWAWDQATGVLVSFETNYFLQNGSSSSFGFANATITSTSLWPPGIGDFGIKANPTSIIITKASINDQFASKISIITLTSISGFSGNVTLAATPAGSLGETFIPSQVKLGANSSANASLVLSAAASPPGTYSVTVTGTSGSLSHSIALTVQVVIQPDFQLYLSIPIGGNVVFAGGATSVGVLLFSNGLNVFNGTVTLTGQVSPIVGNGPTLSFNPTQISFAPTGTSLSQLTISTIATTPPGNYTITVKGTSGTLVHTLQLQLTVLPPPILTLSTSSGPIGTLVRVHGSGFLSPSQGRGFSPVELQITFDDQFVGFFFLQGSSFNFTFNVPDAQAGIVHQIHAKELFPSSLDVQASFLVLPEPRALIVEVSGGTIYFPGDTAIIFAMTTISGQLTTVTSLQLILVKPDGSNLTLSAVLVSPGVYKGSYAIPASGTIGTYVVLIKAHQAGSSDGSALVSFEVKPTWLQSNGRNVITATGLVGAVGTLGVVAFAWRKRYFAKRKDEFWVPKNP